MAEPIYYVCKYTPLEWILVPREAQLCGALGAALFALDAVNK